MSSRGRLLRIACLGAALSVAGRSFAQAPDRPPAEGESPSKVEAHAHFKRGIELYQDNDPQSALIEFRRAYEIAPAYQVLYNIGQVCFLLKDYVGALAAFEKYLAGGGDAIGADRRARVQQDIATLRERIASISVVTEPGAVVFVDGVAVGTAPLAAAVPVSIGKRTIRAVMPSRDPVEKTVVVAGGDLAHVALPFASKPEAPAPPAPMPGGEGHAASRSVPWPLWGVTGALAVGAGVTGGLALGASSSAEDIRKNGGSFSEYQNQQQAMRNLSIVTDIVGGAAIALAVVATIVTLSSGSSSGAGGSPTSPAAGVGVGSGGTLQIRF
jgi:tetratricopeptide (TPR) repeat protein